MKTRLRERREAEGKTQAQVAKEAQISLAQYQNIEYGDCKPRVDAAIRISRSLNSTVEELFVDQADEGRTM